MGPGLYGIICKTNKKIYIGESVQVIGRLNTHHETLKNQIHDCSELQTDWNLYGSQDFLFVCLCIGPEWVNQQDRLQKEEELITLNIPNVYNTSKEVNKNPKFKRKVQYKNQIFNSIAEASRSTKISESQIRRLIKNPSKLEWTEIFDQTPEYVGNEKAKPVSVNGILYRSVREASEQQGIPRRTLGRHLLSNYLIKKNIIIVII